MKIGMFTDTYFPQLSGVSTSIKTLTDELRKQGHQVIIFTTTDPKAEEEQDIVRLASLPFLSFADRRIAYRGFDRCLKIARSMDLDLIHTHTEFSVGLTGHYVASRLKIPLVHTYHTMYENYTHYIMDGMLLQPSHVRALSKQYCNRADGVIAPSQLTQDTLRDYGVTVPIQVIPTGVPIQAVKTDLRQDLRRKMGIQAEDTVLLTLSRLSKEKNIQEVLEAYKELRQTNNNLQLLVAGDGPEREALELYCRKHQLEVDFVGFVDHEHVSDYYQIADLYLNASQSESQGLTYLESLVNRCPIIAKENDYLKSIMVKDSFGRLYTNQETLAGVTAEFLAEQAAGQIAPIQASDLYELSSEKFADEVLAFYQKMQEAYAKEEHDLFDVFFNKIKQGVRELVIGDKIDR